MYTMVFSTFMHKLSIIFYEYLCTDYPHADIRLALRPCLLRK